MTVIDVDKKDWIELLMIAGHFVVLFQSYVQCSHAALYTPQILEAGFPFPSFWGFFRPLTSFNTTTTPTPSFS